MGEYVNSTLYNVIAWGTTAIMTVLSVPLIWGYVRQIWH
jgi:Mn2+/Fe2+ NRAMP family transporter